MAPKQPVDPDLSAGGSDKKKNESGGKKEGSKPPRTRTISIKKGDSSGRAKTGGKPGENAADEDDDSVCFICADKITHYAFGPCDHRCCFKCCLRSRALYKSRMCPVCKVFIQSFHLLKGF